MRPGTYTLAEDQPAGYADGKDTIGTPGGTAGNDQFTNIVLAAGAVGVNNNFGEKFPAVAYTLVVKGPGGVVARQDSLGRYRLNPGDSFTIEVRANDVRPGAGANGGVQAAYADLHYDPNLLNWTAGSLQTAPLFDKSTSGAIDAAHQQIDEAGGAFDLALNGSHYPGAGTPQLLFTVAGQVSAAAPHGSTVTLGLDPADVTGHDTMVYGNGVPVAATYQSVSLLIGSLWRNPTNQWDVNGDGAPTRPTNRRSSVNFGCQAPIAPRHEARRFADGGRGRQRGAELARRPADPSATSEHRARGSATGRGCIASGGGRRRTTAASPETGYVLAQRRPAPAGRDLHLMAAALALRQRKAPRQAALTRSLPPTRTAGRAVGTLRMDRGRPSRRKEASLSEGPNTLLHRRTADYAPLETFSTKPKSLFPGL